MCSFPLLNTKEQIKCHWNESSNVIHTEKKKKLVYQNCNALLISLLDIFYNWL